MQALLTNAIEIVFWAFVSHIIFDFINGLFPVPPMPDVADIQLPAQQQESEEPDTRENALLPDPWLCDNVAITPAIATLPATPLFNRLLLLPPAKSVAIPMVDCANTPISESNPPITQKRKPGRPKKDTPATTVAPKRKPGRPKKIA
ncbi:hypothetical protein [Nostoc sp. GT001]|uniref:hypothetical protein n=1 Tax=Nostoc sp. GT001 TaxID=3056647 RepID=UPI0025AB2CEA|nr:hypothetical protein [Nostoc sp. GT001]MDM9583123.1 hypothetical protein [Nostoc sp. GT001]